MKLENFGTNWNFESKIKELKLTIANLGIEIENLEIEEIESEIGKLEKFERQF